MDLNFEFLKYNIIPTIFWNNFIIIILNNSMTEN